MKAIDKIINISLSVLLCTGFSLPVQSQVTIGNDSPALDGLLLELKQNDVPVDGANSEKGMIFPRVELVGITDLNPLINTADAAVKSTYTGTVVYNVAESAVFEKGLYEWGGTKWLPFLTVVGGSGINANNGLSVSNDGNVQLGGELVKNTDVNLGSNHLIFNRSTGNVGIGVEQPQAALHVADSNNDPLIINELNAVASPTSPTYYNIVAAADGTFKMTPIEQIAQGSGNNSALLYAIRNTFRWDTNNQDGTASGNRGGQFVTWTGGASGGNVSSVRLPASGTYVFSFRLYGTNEGYIDRCHTFFISAHTSNASNATALDVAEVQMCYIDNDNHYWATSTVILEITGTENQEIFIRWAAADGTSGGPDGFTLTSMSITDANRSSLVFWKL